MFRGPRRIEFPRQASICQEGLRMPLNGNKRKAHPLRGRPFRPSQYLQCALYSAAASSKTRALARSLARGRKRPASTEENKFQLSFRRSLQNLLTYASRSFSSGADPFTLDNCITSHCRAPLSPIPLSSPLAREMPFAFLPTILHCLSFFFFFFCHH